MSLKICIINGYPEKNRQALTEAGVAGADDLYLRVLKQWVPDARLDVFMIADPGTGLPGGAGIESYDAPAVRAIMKEAAQDEYRWSSLILGIAKSTPFQMRSSQ